MSQILNDPRYVKVPLEDDGEVTGSLDGIRITREGAIWIVRLTVREPGTPKFQYVVKRLPDAYHVHLFLDSLDTRDLSKDLPF